MLVHAPHHFLAAAFAKTRPPAALLFFKREFATRNYKLHIRTLNGRCPCSLCHLPPTMGSLNSCKNLMKPYQIALIFNRGVLYADKCLLVVSDFGWSRSILRVAEHRPRKRTYETIINGVYSSRLNSMERADQPQPSIGVSSVLRWPPFY